MDARVAAFYARHPYPPPIDDLDAFRATWDDARRRVESCLIWPSAQRDDRSVLVAGCGTAQAARYAIRWPNARVVGIDVSDASLAFERELKDKHALSNLELRQLPVERADELGERFDYVVCTGVLHHLADPPRALGVLAGVVAPEGALNLMVYAPYGRAGVYALQDYCRRIGVEPNDAEIDDLAAALRALPQDHPIVPLLRTSPDFSSKAGLADALLHPRDRAYSVPQLFELLDSAGLTFGRWTKQAPYLPACGAFASTPHAARVGALTLAEQYAAMELFRGTMVRHSIVAYREREVAERARPDFNGDVWRNYVPLRMPDTITVRERLPEGAAAVLINRSHTNNDLYLPIDAAQDRLLSRIDGKRTIADIAETASENDAARAYFEKLGQWDQALFEI